jgi:hypothetical protein
MRHFRTALALAFATLLCAAPAFAADSPDSRTWFGPQVGMPLVTARVGSGLTGMDTGFTIDHMENEYFGVGLDVAYHYWPADDSYRASFERYLRRTYYQKLAAPQWAFTATQVTVHLKGVAPGFRGITPWGRVGAGLYVLSENVEEPDYSGSNVLYMGTPPDRNHEGYGGFVSVGFDFRRTRHTAWGVGGTYHYVGGYLDGSLSTKEMPDFSAVTLGLQVMYSR